MAERCCNDDRATSQRLVTRPSTPLDGLREVVLAAAEELSRSQPGVSGSIAGRAADQPRAPAPRGFRGLLDQRRAALGGGLGSSPREVAQRLGSALQERLGSSLERFEVAGPGFLNLFLADAWLIGALAEVLASGTPFEAAGSRRPRARYWSSSSQPTRPGRCTWVTPAMPPTATRSRVCFEYRGHQVEREFYVNDAGSQVRKLGESVLAAGARGRRCPRTATRATMSGGSRYAGEDGLDRSRRGSAAPPWP